MCWIWTWYMDMGMCMRVREDDSGDGADEQRDWRAACAV